MTNREIVSIRPQEGIDEPYERFNWDAPILVSHHDPKRLYEVRWLGAASKIEEIVGQLFLSHIPKTKNFFLPIMGGIQILIMLGMFTQCLPIIQ